jgi:hypothetical protein
MYETAGVRGYLTGNNIQRSSPNRLAKATSVFICSEQEKENCSEVK